MDQVKNTIQLQNYPAMNQTSFVSIQEDGSTCLKHLVGYPSPKLTPKHTRSVKQSKRRTKNSESPHLEFPPPPSLPPPEHYDLSDEYSADLIESDVNQCKQPHRLNEDLVRFRTIGDDQPAPEEFWNSPVEAPWSYFLDGINKNSGGNEKTNEEKIIYGGRESSNENGNEVKEYWNGQMPEEGWMSKEMDSSTPYVERKTKTKKKNKRTKVTDETTDHISEEIMLINKLKEDFDADESNLNLNDVQGFRSEIWVSAVPSNECESLNHETAQDTSCIQVKKNHISNVLITHGNDEILDNFIENKPIHKGTNNSSNNNVVPNEKYEVHLLNNYESRSEVGTPCEKCPPGEIYNGNLSVDKNKVTVVAGCDYNRQENKPKKSKSHYSQRPSGPGIMGPGGESPDEYSYAYYEPGPANRITGTQEMKKYGHGRNSRYTYTTRYGTEENIYEEITEVSGNLRDCYYGEEGERKYGRVPRHYHRPGAVEPGRKYEGNYMGNCNKSQSQISLNQSIVEEEVREVQSTHRRVLGQLNLTMEEMLMPNLTKEKNDLKEERGDVKKADFLDDNQTNQVTDLDSGFSGSSGTSVSFYGVSNYVRTTAPFRRPDIPRTSLSSNSKIYPQIPFKSKQYKQYSDLTDYRNGRCCGDHCCAQKYQYQFGGRTTSGENSVGYQRSPCYAMTYSSPQSIPNFQRKSSAPSTYSDGSVTRKHLSSAVKSLSFPRGMAASGSFSKRTSGSGSSSSWAKRGWKKLTGLAIGSTNKVNILGSDQLYHGCPPPKPPGSRMLGKMLSKRW
ncbi:hypothetical protein RUM43_013655 [Polyplax serrata]|uniref:Uncharacterized protein n=1 Tax=Polyplax serrata TaxID=468196 RepID=A0AAN8NJJ1_POLSC